MRYSTFIRQKIKMFIFSVDSFYFSRAYIHTRSGSVVSSCLIVWLLHTAIIVCFFSVTIVSLEYCARRKRTIRNNGEIPRRRANGFSPVMGTVRG